MKKRRTTQILLAFFFLVFPFIVIQLTAEIGNSAWGRILALSIFDIGGVTAFLWYFLDPRTVIISKRARLHKMYPPAKVKKIEIGIRILILTLVFLLLVPLAVSFGRDVVLLSSQEKKSPVTMEGKIHSVDTSLFQTWFLYQSISLGMPKDASNTFFLLYSWQRLKEGERYQFTILPHSRNIIDYQPLSPQL